MNTYEIWSELLGKPLTKELQEFYCCSFSTVVLVFCQNQHIEKLKQHDGIVTSYSRHITANLKGLFCIGNFVTRQSMVRNQTSRAF